MHEEFQRQRKQKMNLSFLRGNRDFEDSNTTNRPTRKYSQKRFRKLTQTFRDIIEVLSKHEVYGSGSHTLRNCLRSFENLKVMSLQNNRGMTSSKQRRNATKQELNESPKKIMIAVSEASKSSNHGIRGKTKLL